MYVMCASYMVCSFDVIFMKISCVIRLESPLHICKNSKAKQTVNKKIINKEN